MMRTNRIARPTRRPPLRVLTAGMALLAGVHAGVAWGAGPKAETLFPTETVGFATIADAPDFHERWNRTQIGALENDPAMQPFAESLRAQFNDRVGRLDERFGVMIEDFTDIASGEAAIGLIAVGESRDRDAYALVIDVTGKLAEARALLDKIDRELAERDSNSVGDTEGGSVKVYTIPGDLDDSGARGPSRIAACFLFADRLVASDDPGIARAILDKLQNAGGDGLHTRKSYLRTMERARAAAKGLPPTVEWFLAPFEYDLAVNSEEKSTEGDGRKDTLTILREQGFDAVLGIGGQVTIAADARRDFVHHTAVYAPPKPGTAGKSAAEKYDLAMRMFELPNTDGPFTAEAWAPREVAGFKSVNVDLKNAFDHVGTLFDAFAGYDNAFETTLEGFEKDPYGPKINLRDEVFAHLGSRVTIVTDYTMPISPDCERYLVVIEVDEPDALRGPLDKLLESDGALAREIEGIAYWEIVPEDEAFEDPIDDGLLPLGGALEQYDDQPDEGAKSRSAVCLHEARLTIASDADFLAKSLFGVEQRESLASCEDMRAAVGALADMAMGPRCVWTFTRTDEALRPTYELLREGKMPESKTFVGRFLNRILTTDDQAEAGASREQKINGADLPSFELARRYFGPAARIVRSENDGWIISGVVLSKANE